MGTALVVIGLMLFVQGLDMGLFPIGETRAVAFARKGSLVWLLLFGFGLGFPTTVAESALIAITQEAAKVAAQAVHPAPLVQAFRKGTTGRDSVYRGENPQRGGKEGSKAGGKVAGYSGEGE